MRYGKPPLLVQRHVIPRDSRESLRPEIEVLVLRSRALQHSVLRMERQYRGYLLGRLIETEDTIELKIRALHFVLTRVGDRCSAQSDSNIAAIAFIALWESK